MTASSSEPPTARPVRVDGTMIYRSTIMGSALAKIDRFAGSHSPVLVTGETGTGKDLVARRLHERSGRDGRFEAVNVTALPDSLFERELFGHARGAFTGADDDHRGLVERCDGGTLFLDEIGNLSLDRQATLLRVIEDGRVRRLGDEIDIDVDVRVVVATNEDLPRALHAGRFRHDLWFRIARLHVHLPPLRDRDDDVVEIARRLLDARAADLELDDDARQLLVEHDWPGNVRELEGVIEAAVLLDEDGQVGADDLTRAGIGRDSIAPDARPLLRKLSICEVLPLEEAERRVLRDLRAQAIETALILSDGRKASAADLLGVSRQTLYEWLRDLGYRTLEDDVL